MQFNITQYDDTEVENEATIYAEPTTGYWEDGVLDRYNIRRAFTLHIIPDESKDGCNTADLLTFPIENAFVFHSDATDAQREAAQDTLTFEGLERYGSVMRYTLDSADRRFLARDSVTFDPDFLDVESAWMEARCNGINEPAILDYWTLDSYIREKRDARRALNVPPIANWGINGLDNLPLFVHAANEMTRDMAPALDRIERMRGDCARYRAGKERLRKAGLSWELPSPEAFQAAR